MLVVRVLDIADHNTAACNQSVVFARGMEVNTVVYFTTVTDRVVEFYLSLCRSLHLSSGGGVLLLRNGHLLGGLHIN